MTVRQAADPSARSSQAAARNQHRRFRTAAGRETLAGYLFIAPQLLGFLLFVLVPIIGIIWYSLQRWNVLSGTSSFIGLSNYSQLIHDPVMPTVARVTAVFSVGLVVLNISLALILAILLNQKLRGTTFFRTLFFSPVVVSLVAWTIVWGFMLQNNGGVNALLHLIGVHGPNWLRGEWSALAAVIILQVFKNVGLNMILFLAALQGVPAELHEAARIDGASAIRRFRSITFPMISPTILLVTIITIAGSLRVFAQVQVLTAGGPGHSTTVLAYALYKHAFEFHEFGYGSTLAVVLFVVVFVLTFVQWQLRKKWVFGE